MDRSETEGPEAWLRRISAKGNVGAQIGAHDWSASPLGYPATWAQSMRTVVDLMLESPLAMFVAWGPELAVVYNDPLVECLGDKLLTLIGQPLEEAWGKIAPDFGPLVAPVLAGQINCLKDEPLLIRRNDEDELHNFTFRFSLIPEGENRRAGVFCIVRKTTGRVEDRKRARIAETLREETGILELLNETGALLASTLDLKTLLQSITDAGTQLSGARFGAFFYNGKNAQGEALLLFTMSGAPIEAFQKFGVPRPTAIFSPTFHGGAPIRSADITKDARYGKSAPHFGMPAGHPQVRSYLALPVISRSGEVLGGLFFGHPEAGVFTDRSERMVRGVVAQAAMAIDNARLYDQAHTAAEERKSLLASERSARAEAERLSRTKDEFLAMLAHELRNPLAPISSSANVLNLLFADEPRVRQTSAVILRQVGHMTRLIDDLLDVSRVTRGLIKLELKAVDFRSIVSGALDQTRPLMDVKSHQIVQQIPAEPVWVLGDQTRLTQATANIFNNAAKYTRAGGLIEIELSAEAHWLQLRVRDNGSGMSRELLPTVFDLFTQGARTLARSQGGGGARIDAGPASG